MTASAPAPREPGGATTASSESPPLASLDWLLASGLALVWTLFYFVRFQGRLVGDGGGLAGFYALGTGNYYNILFLPPCRVLGALIPFEDPIGAVKLWCAIGGGAGVGASYLLARWFRAPAFGAMAAAILLALSPGVWFNATMIEPHAPHMFAVALAALATVLLPWERPVRALTLTALVFGATLWTHQTAVLLGPGWVLLVQAARVRRAEPFSWPVLLGVVGPVLLAGLLAALAFSNWMRFGVPSLVIEQQADMIDVFAEGLVEAPRFWFDGWLWPLLLLLPLAALGLWKRALAGWNLFAFAALVGIPTTFFFWWGLSEEGAYVIQSAPFLLAPVAVALHSLGRVRGLVLGACLSLQALAGAHTIARWDRGWRIEDRVERIVELIGEDGAIYTCIDFPKLEIWLPRIKEVSLWRSSARAVMSDQDPEEYAQRFSYWTDLYLSTNERFLYDLSYRDQTDRNIVVHRKPYTDAIEAMLQERYEARLDEHYPSWPMLVVEKRE